MRTLLALLLCLPLLLACEQRPSAPTGPATTPSLLGLNWDLQEADWQKHAAEVSSMRPGWVRLGFDALDRSGHIDFGYFDALTDRLRNRGIGILGLLAGARSSCAAKVSNDDYSSCPPTAAKEQTYADYVEKIVRHFRDRITYWESWNEPNDATYWVTGPDPAAYAHLLALQHRAVKRGNPSAQLLFAATGPTNLPWTARVLEALGGEHPFEAVALHPYRFVSPDQGSAFNLADGTETQVTMKQELVASAELFRRYEAVHARANTTPDTWITEYGWGAISDTGGELAAGVQLVSYQRQADFLRLTVTELRDDPELSFVKAAFWWSEYDVTNLPDSEAYFRSYGLLHNDYRPKPAAETFRSLPRPATPGDALASL